MILPISMECPSRFLTTLADSKTAVLIVVIWEITRCKESFPFLASEFVSIASSETAAVVEANCCIPFVMFFIASELSVAFFPWASEPLATSWIEEVICSVACIVCSALAVNSAAEPLTCTVFWRTFVIKSFKFVAIWLNASARSPTSSRFFIRICSAVKSPSAIFFAALAIPLIGRDIRLPTTIAIIRLMTTAKTPRSIIWSLMSWIWLDVAAILPSTYSFW